MTKELREVYVNTVKQIALNDPSVYVIEADLATSMGTHKIKKDLGANYVDVGIAEGQAVCVAAGIAAAKGIPFVHSFASFISRRAYDQIFISLGYAGQHAILTGSDAGLSSEANGGTHMSLEDIALMRSIPNCDVYDICDGNQLVKVLERAYKTKKLTYIRTSRKQALNVYHDIDDINLDKGYNVIKEGTDATIVVSGIVTKEALIAAEILEKKDISTKIINVHRVNKLSDDLLFDVLEDKTIFTIENHNTIGGLGSSVAELFSEKKPTKIVRLGIDDQFGQVGNLDYLLKAYGLDGQSIADKISKTI